MASRDCSSVGMLLCIFLCLGSAHRLLLEPHEHNLVPSLAQAPSPSKHVHENSLAPSVVPTPFPKGHIPEQSLAPSPSPVPCHNKHLHEHSLAPSLSPASSPNKHIHEHSLAPSLSRAPSPTKNIHEHSLAPSLSRAPSPTKHIHEHSLAPSLAVASSPSKHIQPSHHEWIYKSDKEAKDTKTKHQESVSEPVLPGLDPTTEPWFLDPQGDKQVSKPWAVLTRNNPTTDQQHDHPIPRGRISRPDLREGSEDDFIFGGTSSNSSFDTGHENLEDEPLSFHLDSVYERPPSDIRSHVEEDLFGELTDIYPLLD